MAAATLPSQDQRYDLTAATARDVDIDANYGLRAASAMLRLAMVVVVCRAESQRTVGRSRKSRHFSSTPLAWPVAGSRVMGPPNSRTKRMSVRFASVCLHRWRSHRRGQRRRAAGSDWNNAATMMSAIAETTLAFIRTAPFAALVLRKC